MTPIEKVHFADEGVTLKEANDIIWEYKLNALPVLDGEGKLVAFVFRKDYESKKEHSYGSVQFGFSTRMFFLSIITFS